MERVNVSSILCILEDTFALWGGQREHRLPQGGCASAISSGKKEQRLTIDLLHQDLALLLPLVALELVTFGRYKEKGAVMIGEKVSQGCLLCFRTTSDIENDDHPAQVRRVYQIVFNQSLPGRPLRLGNFGIAVAGQVHKGQDLVDGKKIELSRATWGLARPGNFLVQEPVD